MGALVLLAILRHWVPSGLLYLYLWDLAHQVLFYIGGILALIEWLMVKYVDTPIEKRFFTGIVLVLLFIASFQAWVDEHHNSEQLTTEKASAVGEREFWKSQSYSKDDTLRIQSRLLDQNLINTNQVQKNYNDLVAKVLSLTKPEHVQLNNYLVELPLRDTISLGKGKSESFIVVADRVVSPIKLEVMCNAPIRSAGGAPMGANAMTSIGWGGFLGYSNGVYRWGIGLGSPAWAPSTPMLVTVDSSEARQFNCAFEEH